jgi:hypothetical protein
VSKSRLEDLIAEIAAEAMARIGNALAIYRHTEETFAIVEGPETLVKLELFNPARCSVRDDLPERTEGILPYVAIRSNDHEAVRDRLADQHAVERVSMERREPGEV